MCHSRGVKWRACVIAGIAFIAGCGGGVRESRDEIEWRLQQVSADGRELQIGYTGGGCSKPNGRAEVTETATSVGIRLTVPREDRTDQNCPAILRIYRTLARLDRPIDGRAVVGGPTCPLCAGGVQGGRMPRLIGLRLSDARNAFGSRLLREFRAEVKGDRDAMVVSQFPQPGTRLIPRHSRRTRQVRIVAR